MLTMSFQFGLRFSQFYKISQSRPWNLQKHAKKLQKMYLMCYEFIVFQEQDSRFYSTQVDILNKLDV